MIRGQAVAPLTRASGRLVSRLGSAGTLLAACAVTLVVGALVIAATGFSPATVFLQMGTGALGSATGLAGSLVYATPIAFTSLAAAIAFRAGVWNIGGDGQLVMGAFGASLVALSLPATWGYLLLPLVVLGGFAGGALWALVAAVLREYLAVNEILSTLMLNYVAFLWVDFLLVGPWKDLATGGWPMSAPFPTGARFPGVGGTGIHLGLALAMMATIGLHVVLRHSRWGYELRIQGEAPGTARYAGMPVRRNVLLVMLLSGGLAGLAGAGEVAGVGYRLFQLNREGYGYSGILVSWLAGHVPLAALGVAGAFGALLQGGSALKLAGIPPAVVRMLQAVLILCLLAGLEIRRQRQAQTPGGADDETPSGRDRPASPARAMGDPGNPAADHRSRDASPDSPAPGGSNR